jgi:hypothetical protein
MGSSRIEDSGILTLLDLMFVPTGLARFFTKMRRQLPPERRDYALIGCEIARDLAYVLPFAPEIYKAL